VSDLSHETADDAFHEIQLSGKQLVFLFMATTVVSVVIFLCGVLVGRGVRVEGAAGTEAPTVEAGTAPRDAGSPAQTAAVDVPPPTAEPNLTYPRRLDSEKAPTERVRRQADAPASRTPAADPDPSPEQPAPAPANASAAPPASKPTPAADAASASPVPAAAGLPRATKTGRWVVQVQALRERSDADAIVQRLKAKGYDAFLQAPDAKAPDGMYRVQIGRFDDRADAERIAARLQQEEKFSPWVRR
jgi:cell division septation protein DedD